MDASVSVNPTFETQLAAIIDQRLGMAVDALAEVARDKVSQPYPPAAGPLEPPHRRTGGLQRAIFSEKSSEMDWVFGVRHVESDPSRPGSNRERLGLWMELGTGRHRRHPTGTGGMAKRPPEIIRTSVYPHPFLLPTLMNDGPRVVGFYLRD